MSVCLGGGVAGEANAVGLHGSGLTLAVVERELAGRVPISQRKVTGKGEHHEQYASRH